MPTTQHTDTFKLGESMKQTLFMGLGVGICMGMAIGFSIKPEESQEPIQQSLTEIPKTNAVTAVDSTKAMPSEQELLLLAIEELNLTTTELEEAKRNMLRMERKARRYDWLRDNGLHGNRSMSFDKNSFEPQQKLIDFLGLNEHEISNFKQLSEKTRASTLAWESEHAVCTEDSHTNCTFEVSALPDSFREDYVAHLGELLHEEDVQLLGPAIDEMFSDYSHKRTVSASLIPAEVYAETMRQRGRNVTWEPQDMIKIREQKFDEKGNKRGSSSSTFSMKQNSLTHNHLYKRWNHLFDLESFAE